MKRYAHQAVVDWQRVGRCSLSLPESLTRGLIEVLGTWKSRHRTCWFFVVLIRMGTCCYLVFGRKLFTDCSHGAPAIGSLLRKLVNPLVR